MISIGSALLACALCLGFGAILGMFFLACCVVSGRGSRQEDPLAGLSANDRIWWSGN
jgi:hypothetical protein